MRARTQPPSDDDKPESGGDSFMRLLRRIVGVPKAEIDRREAEYKRGRRRAKKRRLAAVAKVILSAFLIGIR